MILANLKKILLLNLPFQENFSDVVKWLKANTAEGNSLFTVESQNSENKVVFETNNGDINLSQEKTGFIPSGTTTSFATSWSSGVFSSGQTSGFTSVSTTVPVSSSLSSGVFSNSQNPGSTPTGTATNFANSFSSKTFSNSQAHGCNPADTTTTFATSSSSQVFSNSQTPGFTPAVTTTSFMNSWSSGGFPNIQKPVSFGGIIFFDFNRISFRISNRGDMFIIRFTMLKL